MDPSNFGPNGSHELPLTPSAAAADGGSPSQLQSASSPPAKRRRTSANSLSNCCRTCRLRKVSSIPASLSPSCLPHVSSSPRHMARYRPFARGRISSAASLRIRVCRVRVGVAPCANKKKMADTDTDLVCCYSIQVKCTGNPGNGPCSNCARLELACPFVTAAAPTQPSGMFTYQTTNRRRSVGEHAGLPSRVGFGLLKSCLLSRQG